MMVKVPSSLAAAVRVSEVLTLVNVIFALGTAWPEASRTFPAIVPVTVIWAVSGRVIIAAAMRIEMVAFGTFTPSECNGDLRVFTAIGCNSTPRRRRCQGEGWGLGAGELVLRR